MSYAWPVTSPAATPGPSPGGLLRRTGALLLDLLIVMVTGFAGAAFLAAMAHPFHRETLPWAIFVALSLLLVGAGPFVYFGVGWSRGATPGMRACQLRVVDDENAQPLALPQIILRLAGAVLSVLVFFVGFLWIGLDRRRRGWHDHYSGSRVVHEPLAPAALPWVTAGAWGPVAPWQGAPPGQGPPPWHGPTPSPPPGWGPPPSTPWPGPAPHPPGWGQPPLPPWQGAPPSHPPGWGPPRPWQGPPPAWPPPSAAPIPPAPAPAPATAAPLPASTTRASQARSGWRALATQGRSAWTWTDVAPLMLLFIPLLYLTSRLLVHLVVAIQHGQPHGTTRALDVVIVDLASYLPALALLYISVRLRRHGHLRDLGLGRVNLRWIGAVIPFVMAAYVFEAATGVISLSLFPNTPATQCKELSREFGGNALVALVTAVLAAPFVEELFFRGFLLRYLRDRMPIVWAVVLSSALFSLAHFSYGQPTLFLPIFSTGLVLGAIYHYSGSLWPAVLTHATFNLVATVQLLTHAHC